jgi:hypothetical protein
VIDGTVTTTIPAPTTTITVLPKRDVAKRSVAYPTWLPTTYAASRVSSACGCLSISQSVATTTTTAEAVTLTSAATVTATTTSIIHSTAIATATALPLISTRRTKIEVLRKDTQASVGWLYNSAGPAITTDVNQAGIVDFTLSPGATTGSAVRITLEGVVSPSALGFVKSSNPTNVVELENG